MGHILIRMSVGELGRVEVCGVDFQELEGKGWMGGVTPLKQSKNRAGVGRKGEKSENDKIEAKRMNMRF